LASTSVLSLEAIRSQVRALHDQYEELESQLLEEDQLEASMLCEVDRLNLGNLLRVFGIEVEIDFGSTSSQSFSQPSVEDDSRRQSDNMISDLEQRVSNLKEEIVLLRSELIVKVRLFPDRNSPSVRA
jgi:hypothetical protein